jgi:hypothetical protein
MRQTTSRGILPVGLVIDGISLEAGRMLISARPGAVGGVCQDRGLASTVPIGDIWRLADLHAQGHPVRLNVQVRRF